MGRENSCAWHKLGPGSDEARQILMWKDKLVWNGKIREAMPWAFLLLYQAKPVKESICCAYIQIPFLCPKLWLGNSAHIVDLRSQLKVVPGGSQAQFSAYLWWNTWNLFASHFPTLSCLQEDFTRISLQQLQLLLTRAVNARSLHRSFNSHTRTFSWPKIHTVSRHQAPD